MHITLRGAKGSDGGDFTQKPDDLRSADTFEGLLGLCAGPIKGPVRGLKSIRVNGTPIENETGAANFPEFVAVFADGDPLKFPQIAKLKLGSAGAPVNVGVAVPNTDTTGGVPGTWVSRTLNNTGAEAVDLRFIVNQLYKQTESGIFENTLHLEINMKPIGTATWINPFASNGNTTPAYNEGGYDADAGKNSFTTLFFGEESYTSSTGSANSGLTLTVTGKTTSPYVKELRVSVPNTGVYANKGWDIRVRLIEPASIDADPEFEKRTVTWESMTAVFASELGNHEDWRALSWLQCYGKASDNFNGLPAIDGIYYTKIVQVPPLTVYNPDTRLYTATTWNGSWAKAYTNDPAWVINDVISDAISGVSSFVTGAYLNKWDALELSKWCSERVPDGSGIVGQTHPRFSMNLYVDQSQRSDEFIRYLAGACGGTAWEEGSGQWRIMVDKPRTPAAIFTHENIEGEFLYQHTDVDTRFNDITIAFLNEEFDYREDRLRIYHDADIAKNGRKPTRLVAVGCTNRQQALRWAVLRLRTNVNEYRMVTLTTNRQGKHLERFDHILVSDSSLNATAEGANRTTGRIIENKGGSIVVRDALRLEVGVAYTLHLTVPNPNYNPEPTTQPGADWKQPTITVTRTVTNDAAHRGDVTELFLNTPLPANAAVNAPIALEATGLPAIPRTYRVLDVIYNADGEHITINAMEVDTGKWDAADAATDENLQSLFSDDMPPPIAPVGGMFTLSAYTGAFGVKRMLVANWDRPSSLKFDKFRLEYRFNQGPWQDMGFQREDFWEKPQPQVGRHELRVYAVGRDKTESLPILGSIAVPDLPGSLAVSFGPATIVGTYDNTGATPQDLPKDALYKLSTNGVNIAQVTWQYRVVDGGVNGFNPSSGWKPMTVTGGVGTFTLTSVEVVDSQIEIKGTATVGGTASFTVNVTKAFAPPPTGTAIGASQTSGFTPIATPGGSFVPVTSTLTINMPSGSSATNTVVNLSARMDKIANNDGPWDIEYKLQRYIGGVWTDVGTVKHSNPDPYTDYTDTGTAGSGGGGAWGTDIP